ncbi:MAG: Nramp family divalent metal transporter [Woeseia sp.]|nr:Nramp family divalent metal transporter [Woeseia sp.]MBT6210502.1 Nramp family divalent metal transporter [Woeseia sp.]MDE0756165.1 Nramp family divalent metal transporter [Woeseiaceae bacterium]
MSEPTTDNDSFDSLELPSMTPGSLAKKFGPGMMLMMTGIGTSHLITAPVAGGRYGYALLWCLPIAYIFKYYGFEMAIRFTHATGRSMLDAYATAWKKIPVWYVLITTVIQSTVGQAGRLIAAAAVVFYFFRLFLGVDIPGFDDDKELAIYAFLLAILSVTIILRGRYAVVELVTKIAAGILIVCTLSVFIVQPAPVSEFVHFFQLETPEGSWLLIASFLGLLPTGIDVSLQASEWGKAKKVGMGRLRPEMEARGLATRFDSFESSKKDLSVDVSKLPSHAQEYCRRWFKIGLIDFRFGHVISFILATIFLMLAAVWLYPSDVSGNAVMGEIAKIFTESVGPSLMIVFLAGALAATFSTAFNYFDGWPRVVGACCRNLFRKTAQLPRTSREELDDEQRKVWYSEYNIYRISMFFSLITSVAIIAGIPRPVYLVLVASALAYFVAPVIYFLNLYYCQTVIPKDDKLFYPSPFAIWFGWLSLVVFVGLSAILVLQRLFGISLF